MSSRSAAKMARPASKPVSKSSARKPKAKLAKVTKFPTASMKKPLPAAKRSPPPPAARKPDPSPRGMPALTPPKQVQEPKQSLARSFYWSELRMGDDLPPLTKPAIDRVQIVRYASSSGDFNRLHLDEPYAHAVGFPGLFAPGMLRRGPAAPQGQAKSSRPAAKPPKKKWEGVWPRHSARPRGVIRRSVLRRPSRHGRQRSRPPRPTRDARPKPASSPGRRGTR